MSIQRLVRVAKTAQHWKLKSIWIRIFSGEKFELGGGSKHFLFLAGEMIQVDEHIFQIG